MIWTAVVPLKPSASRKGRLAERLSPVERQRLSVHLFERTVDVLQAMPAVGTIHLLQAERPAGWAGSWSQDEGRGLNPELQAVRAGLSAEPLFVIHADLPLANADDIAALLAAAEAEGYAIAPDRHGVGTNAVALMPGLAFRFAFGADSFALHLAQTGAAARLERPGLALDCDTPDDLDHAVAAGFLPPC